MKNYSTIEESRAYHNGWMDGFKRCEEETYRILGIKKDSTYKVKSKKKQNKGRKNKTKTKNEQK
jgi:hypothetical protein